MTIFKQESTALLDAITWHTLRVLTTASINDEQMGADWWEKRCAEEPGCAECKCFDL